MTSSVHYRHWGLDPATKAIFQMTCRQQLKYTTWQWFFSYCKDSKLEGLPFSYDQWCSASSFWSWHCKHIEIFLADITWVCIRVCISQHSFYYHGSNCCYFWSLFAYTVHVHDQFYWNAWLKLHKMTVNRWHWVEIIDIWHYDRTAWGSMVGYLSDILTSCCIFFSIIKITWGLYVPRVKNNKYLKIITVASQGRWSRC